MALADNLLTPIPGPNPSGSYLRYEGAYDRIKEARRADDELDKGDYKRPGPPKISEYEQVRKAAESALANQSKDLQIAAWLTEALIYGAGFAGLRDGLELCRGLLERFWDTLYPEIDDGDLEFRLAPLEWVATKLDFAIQSVPLARGGLGWFKYKESRTVGYETDTAGNDKKLERRLSAIADKKITAEAFDRAVKETSVEALQQTASDLAGAIDATNALEAACRQKFGNAAPGFGPARELLQEIRHRVGSFVDGRSEAETKAVAAVEEVPPVNGFPSVPLALSREIAPAESGGAAESIVAIAAAMRRDNPASPIPYLLLRALRWGELRAAGTDLDGIPLEPPSTEIRMRLRSLFTEGDWENLIEAAENAMSQPCGCAWLDLQRYVVKACAELGGSYDAVAAALRSELKALIADYPALPETNLRDDTPAANPDTKAWLNELIPPDRPARPPSPEPPTFVPRFPEHEQLEAIDVYELAEQAARSGRHAEAVEMLAGEAARERSGRARFQRRIQIAQICIASGRDTVARPILRDIVAEIDARKLEDWEDPEMLSHALALLYRLENAGGEAHDNANEKERVFARLCRLDAGRALELAP